MSISASNIVSSNTLNELRTQFNNLVTDVTAIEGGTLSYTVLETTTLNSTTLNVKEDGTIIFEGATEDSHQTTLTVVDPTADRTITFPNETGTVHTSGGDTTHTNIIIADGANIGSASDTNAMSISSGGVVSITATTANTSVTDGALTVGGGLGVAADLSIGDDLRLISDATVLSFGANSDVTLTHVHDTGLLLNGTSVIQFNDASQSIGAPSNAILDINATDEIELNATLLDVNANINASGTYTGAGLMTTGGNIVIPDAGTIGSASSTGAITVASTGIVTLVDDLVLKDAATIGVASSTSAITIASTGIVTLVDDLLIKDGGTIGSASSTGAITVASTGIVTFVDDILIKDAGTIGSASSTGAITIASSGIVTLVDDLILKDAATIGVTSSTSAITIASTGIVTLVDDLILKDAATIGVTSSTSAISIASTGIVTFVDDIIIKDAGTIGSASDEDAISISSAGVVNISATTASTNSTSGALTVAGGAGIAADLGVGDDLRMISDGAIIAFGVNGDINLTHVHDDGLTSNGTFHAAGDVTGSTLNADGDTAAGDNAAIGYTAAEGLILTGQGSTNDVTIKNDADADVIEIPTGTVNVTMAGTLGVTGVVSGAGFTAGSAVLAEAELELLDGLTAGTAIASKVVTTDSDIDTTGQRNLTISGELDAATGDFSGVVDVAGALTTAAITASGIIKTDDTTNATSTTDGSLQTDGGLSVALDAVFGDDVKLLTDSAVLSFGAGSDATLTHTNDVGLTLNSTNKLMFNDATQFIQGASGTVLNIAATDEVDITSTLIDINGNVEISGTTAQVGVATFTARDIHSGGITVADAGNIGSASDLDAIAIGADGDITLTQDLELQHDGAILSFGANDEIALTHVHDTGLLLTDSGGSPTLQLHNASEAVSSDGSKLILTSNGVAFSLPTADGDSGQVMTTNGSGVFAFSDVSASSLAADDISGGDAAILLTTSSGNITVDAAAGDSDIIFKGTDGSADTVFLTIDGSDGGTLIANHNLELGTDASAILFGANNEVILTHVHDKGLALKHTATADGKPVVLTLQTGETDIAANNVIGKIDFQAPDEGTGTDAILVAAAIQARSEGDFAADNNATSIDFMVGASEAAATKMTLSSAGSLDVLLDITGSTINADGDTAAGDNAAMGYTAAEGLILTGQGSTNDITIKNDADADVIEVPTGTVNVTMAGTLTTAGAITSNAGVVVDEMTLDADTLTCSDAFIIDAAADITLDAAGDDILLKSAGTHEGNINLASSNLTFKSIVSDKDMIFQGNDGGSAITALTIDMSAAGAATFNNDVTAFSDERLKRDIETIPNALDKVCQMRGVTFERIDDEGSRSMGVIAQEIEKIIPEVVREDSSEEKIKSVAYGNLVGVLIEAIKELKDEVEQLKNK